MSSLVELYLEDNRLQGTVPDYTAALGLKCLALHTNMDVSSQTLCGQLPSWGPCISKAGTNLGGCTALHRR
jgi:hypothetical protein